MPSATRIYAATTRVSVARKTQLIGLLASYDGCQETTVSRTPFHIAFPVDDLDAARTFLKKRTSAPFNLRQTLY
jgi:hypothetical protein